MSIADGTDTLNSDPADGTANDNAEAEILRVLRGNPNPAEVAALLIALAHVRARNAADADPSGSGAAAPLPAAASWDRPQPVVYRAPASWMRVA